MKRMKFALNSAIGGRWLILLLVASVSASASGQTLVCPSLGGGAADDATTGSIFNVGQSIIGSVDATITRLEAGVMICYVDFQIPGYMVGFTWDFRADYSAVENPVSDAAAVIDDRNMGLYDGVPTPSVWWYAFNNDGFHDGAYQLGQRGTLTGFAGWIDDPTNGPAVVDALNPPPPIAEPGLIPEVSGAGEAVVGWRSPIDGEIQIRGRWIDRSDVVSTDGMNWFIEKNAGSPLLDSSVVDAGPPPNSNFGPINTGVSIGDMIFFILDNGPIGDGTNDGALLLTRIRFAGLTGAPILPVGDANADGVVDLDDYAIFESLMSGPAVLVSDGVTGWVELDFDLDADLDLYDFGQLQLAFAAP